MGTQLIDEAIVEGEAHLVTTQLLGHVVILRVQRDLFDLIELKVIVFTGSLLLGRCWDLILHLNTRDTHQSLAFQRKLNLHTGDHVNIGLVLATALELGTHLQIVIVAIDDTARKVKVVLVLIAKRSAADFGVLKGVYIEGARMIVLI